MFADLLRRNTPVRSTSGHDFATLSGGKVSRKRSKIIKVEQRDAMTDLYHGDRFFVGCWVLWKSRLVDDCCHLFTNSRSRTISRVVDEFEDVCEQTGVTLSRPWNCGNVCYGRENGFGSC